MLIYTSENTFTIISQGKLRLFEVAYPSVCYLDVNLVWNMEENSNHIVRGFW